MDDVVWCLKLCWTWYHPEFDGEVEVEERCTLPDQSFIVRSPLWLEIGMVELSKAVVR